MNIVNIAMRFVHIFSAIALLGGALAWVVSPLASLEKWRVVAFWAIAGLIVSGTWNFLHKTNLPPVYHSLFGIKILLALHVFAVTVLATRPAGTRRQRQLTGVVISGVVIVILSAILRSLTLV